MPKSVRRIFGRGGHVDVPRMATPARFDARSLLDRALADSLQPASIEKVTSEWRLLRPPPRSPLSDTRFFWQVPEAYASRRPLPRPQRDRRLSQARRAPPPPFAAAVAAPRPRDDQCTLASLLSPTRRHPRSPLAAAAALAPRAAHPSSAVGRRRRRRPRSGDRAPPRGGPQDRWSLAANRRRRPSRRADAVAARWRLDRARDRHRRRRRRRSPRPHAAAAAAPSTSARASTCVADPPAPSPHGRR